MRNGTSEGSWTIQRKKRVRKGARVACGSCPMTTTVSSDRKDSVITDMESLKGEAIPLLRQHPPSTSGSGRWPGSWQHTRAH